MNGCCGGESLKFKTEAGEIDEKRLEESSEKLKAAGWPDTDIAWVKRCDCPCHQDGLQVLC